MFKSVLEFASFADRWALLRPDELPWAAIFGPSGDSTIVIFEPLLQFCGHADVKATFLLEHAIACPKIGHFQKALISG
jgi:hypothetical protein